MYIILVVTFGFALMIAEIAIGRKTGKSPIDAFRSLSRKWNFLGVLTTAVPVLILPIYCLIGGWVLKYLAILISGQVSAAAADGYFAGYISQSVEPSAWLSLFVVLTMIIVMCGVQKGIEKASKVMMPILSVLAVVIALFVICQPGASEGLKFYLLPDFSKFSPMTVLAAMGQLFYSMSLAMGIMITYGSYMKKDQPIESCVKQIELFDFGMAFVAGLMIIPAIFIFGDGEVSKGTGLMFEVLPKVFDNMAMGGVIGTAFFLLVLVAALTSSISVMEAIVATLQDRLNWNRKVACLVVTLYAIAVGIPCSLGFGKLSGISLMGMNLMEFFDFSTNSVLMPIVALLTCLFIGFVIKPKMICDEVESSGSFKRKKMFVVFIKYIAPVFIVLILLSSIADGIGLIKI